MGNTIAEQTWESIAAANASIRQSERNQKQGEAQIAQANRPSNLKQIEADLVLACDSREANAKGASQSAAFNKRPQLPNPYLCWNAFQGKGEQEGLIAIIGAVLALQAKTNSCFWSTLWKQASASMMQEVKFAPIICQAIQNQYHAQQLSTEAQANQSHWSGIVNLSAFGLCMVMGGMQEMNDPLEKTPTDPQITMEEEPDADISPAPGGTGDPGGFAPENDVTEEINQSESFADRASRYKDIFMDGSSRATKRFMGFFGHGMQNAMGIGMVSQGITGLWIESKYQTIQASWQGVEGASASQSKQGEMYSQFYGQDFSREEDLRQGSSQNIDYTMNILQQAANTITSTVKSMFGG